MFSPSNKIITVIVIIIPILLYIMATVTNNKEINIHETIIENEWMVRIIEIIGKKQ
jgi:uncharacterized membrane protein YkvI